MFRDLKKTGFCFLLACFWSIGVVRPLPGQDITTSPQRADSQIAGWFRVTFDDAGEPGQQPHLTSGSDYLFPENDIPVGVARAGHPIRTAAFGSEVRFMWQGLRPQARYRLRLSFLSDDLRTQQILVNDRVIIPELSLPDTRILYCIFDVPLASDETQLHLKVRSLQGPNAVISIAELFSNQRSLMPDPVFEANGDCQGRIQGFLFDRNAPDSPYAGLPIRIPAQGKRRALSTSTDDSGTFEMVIPPAWNVPSVERVQVEALLPEGSLRRHVPRLGIFPPRLTPRPIQSKSLIDPHIDLNGSWRFHPQPPPDFISLSAQQTSGWKTIQVPGEWSMSGFKVEPDTAAAYARSFDLPQSWKNFRILLRCDGVYSEAVVFINGKRAGSHSGGFTVFELDVTDLVKPGENFITLSVKAESLQDILASGNQYAAHSLGGITRKIGLWAIPDCFISGLNTSTLFDQTYSDATLDLELEIRNSSDRVPQSPVLHVSLRDRKGNALNILPGRIALPAPDVRSSKRGHIRISVPKPLKWDPEHPHLYTLYCALEYGGRLQETLSRRIGFRQIQVRGQEVFLNGQPVKLRGINRHEAHPLLGRSLNPELWKKDARLFREANINYIRTSHYPPAEEFLDACDELGLLVENEAPLCWVQHGANTNWNQPGWDYRDQKFYLPILLANLESLEANRHHTSIFLWSLANESRWSPLFKQVLDMVRRIDPTRPVSFHDQAWGQYNNAGSTADIANYHYPGPAWSSEASEMSRPLLFGEFCHLNAYNRHELVTDPGLRDAWGPAFQNMWESMYAAPGILGGAIWSGIDDSFFLPNGLVVGYGTWGPLDGWRRTKPEFWHIKKTYAPVQLANRSVKWDQQNKFIPIDLENRHDFTDVEELTILWSLDDGRSGRTTARIPPRQTGTLTIPVLGQDLEGQILKLDILSPQNYLINRFRLPLGSAPLEKENTPLPETQPQLEIKQEADSISLSAPTFALHINNNTGKIRRLEKQGRILVTGGPELMILPLNPAGGTQMTPEAQEFATFTDPCSGWQLKSLDFQDLPEGNFVRITGSYDIAEGEFTLLLIPEGEIDLSYRFVCRTQIDPRQIGLVFSLPREMDTLFWHRQGQWSTYPEDHIGRLQGRAQAFPGSPLSGPAGPEKPPAWPWAQDINALGSRDFRSTKTNILNAGLTGPVGQQLTIVSDGRNQHIRCWVQGNSVRMLVADYSNAGAERFYRRHAQSGYRPLEPGDIIEGTVRLRFKKNE
jgi:beta-galactosidase